MINTWLEAQKLHREMLDKAFTKKDQKKIKKQQEHIAYLFDSYIKEVFLGVHRQAIKYIVKDIEKRKDVELEDLLHQVYADAFAQLRDVIMEVVQRTLIQDSFVLGFAIGGLAQAGMGISDSTIFTD